jgi:hypothetical protein
MNWPTLSSALIATMLLVLGSEPVSAQQRFTSPFYTPPRQPLSPYLNLLRGGNPAVNYYLGVLPDRQQRRAEAIDLFAGQEPAPRSRVDDLDDTLPSLPETGHAVRFLNYGPFYNLGNSAPASSLYPARPRSPR